MTHGIKQNSKGFYIYDTMFKAPRHYHKTLKAAKQGYYIYLNILGLTSDQAEAIVKEVKV